MVEGGDRGREEAWHKRALAPEGRRGALPEQAETRAAEGAGVVVGVARVAAGPSDLNRTHDRSFGGEGRAPNVQATLVRRAAMSGVGRNRPVRFRASNAQRQTFACA